MAKNHIGQLEALFKDMGVFINIRPEALPTHGKVKTAGYVKTRVAVIGDDKLHFDGDSGDFIGLEASDGSFYEKKEEEPDDTVAAAPAAKPVFTGAKVSKGDPDPVAAPTTTITQMPQVSSEPPPDPEELEKLWSSFSKAIASKK